MVYGLKTAASEEKQRMGVYTPVGDRGKRLTRALEARYMWPGESLTRGRGFFRGGPPRARLVVIDVRSL